MENQAKARGITPVQSEHSEAELNVAMKPVNMGSPSKSWDNARAQNPVPVTTNQPPIVAPQSETSGTITANPELAEKIKETRVAFDDYGRTADLVEEDTISNQMQNAWENFEGENQGLDVSVNVPSPDEVEPLFQINLLFLLIF